MNTGTVAAIGYLGIDSADLAAWERLATEVIGAEVGRGTTDGVLRLKLDTYEHRISIHRAAREGLGYLGWEFAGDADLDATLERLARLGVQGVENDLDVAVARGVGRLVQLEGPDKVPLELFVGARREDTRPFRSPTDACFVAEGLGFGHVVLWTEDYETTIRFYTEGLGLAVTDFIIQGPFRAGFLGCNPRHHSVAVFSAPGVPPHLDHFMLEMTDLSMVGRAHDRCLQGLGEIAYTLGQHWNDRATSFYVRTPSGFNIEVGWGAIKVDRASWVSHLGNGDISVWGHHARNADDARKLRADSWVADLSLVTE
jgi:2,3-dihydroxybiphenyl 1,2-dioxygenase